MNHKGKIILFFLLGIIVLGSCTVKGTSHKKRLTIADLKFPLMDDDFPDQSLPRPYRKNLVDNNISDVYVSTKSISYHGIYDQHENLLECVQHCLMCSTKRYEYDSLGLITYENAGSDCIINYFHHYIFDSAKLIMYEMTSIDKDTTSPDFVRYAKQFRFDTSGDLVSIHCGYPVYIDTPDFFIVDTFCYDNDHKITSVQHKVVPVKDSAAKNNSYRADWASAYLYHNDTLYYITTTYSDSRNIRRTFFNENGLPRETMIGSGLDSLRVTVFDYDYIKFKTPQQ